VEKAGNPGPSQDDIEAVTRLAQAGTQDGASYLLSGGDITEIIPEGLLVDG
jgi:hypothetical protein